MTHKCERCGKKDAYTTVIRACKDQVNVCQKCAADWWDVRDAEVAVVFKKWVKSGAVRV